jgi:EAL domain-containing protein (putative c-di-GMP-specific phosphodiesterase class I)
MLKNPAFIQQAVDLCSKHDIEPERVIFELTETSAVDDSALALEFITRLRMKGFHAAIDDVGTGHASFLQLARLPFSELKIDKSFVIASAESAKSRAIVKSFIQLARNLKLGVIAEGVENREALEFLAMEGCELAQGYYIARPMTAERARTWLAEHKEKPALAGGSDRNASLP